MLKGNALGLYRWFSIKSVRIALLYSLTVLRSKYGGEAL
jgi:hypothetical protein